MALNDANQFGNLKLEIAETGWKQSAESARYFYETRAAVDRNNFDTAIGFKNADILGLQNKSEVLQRIDGLERKLDNDKIRQLEIENQGFKTMVGIRGFGAVPAIPMHYAPTTGHVGNSANIYQQQIDAGIAGGYGYGY